MVSLVSLALPILLSAVLVFVVSSIVHMVLRYHRKDYLPIPEEESVRAALGKQKLSPGQYAIPWCGDMKQMKSPEMMRKYEEGPVGFITIRAPGRVNMGKHLLQWFLFSVGISFVVAYVDHLSLASGTAYMIVFRVTATAAWLGYGGAVVWAGIWHGTPWSRVWVDVFDGLLYALATAGVFASMWPR